jgi:hypothetical protein
MVSPPAGGGDARRRQEGESDGHAMPPSDWNALTDDIQLALSREAMRRAAETLAEQVVRREALGMVPLPREEHAGPSERVDSLLELGLQRRRAGLGQADVQEDVRRTGPPALARSSARRPCA